MSAVAAKPAAGGAINGTAMAVGVVMFLILMGICYYIYPTGLMPLLLIVVGGVMIGFGVHFVPVGGAPAAMGQAPGIATGVAMLAAGGGLAGLFGGAWAAAAGQDALVVVITGGIGGGLMMAITCMMVNFVYVFGMGIPAASGKVANDPITGDSQAEYKSQGTEGHGLPFVSFVGGVIGGLFAGAGGTLIYLELLEVYKAALPGVMQITAAQVLPIAVSAAGMFAVGMFLVNAVLTAYNITGTIEGPHDPKFKRWPRSVVASAVASALCGLVAILIVAL
ncbi:tetrahydromethanopterin S-methyltransferase subunit D [Methanoregula formicica]|uniref:Tetrahydromethanopterin S-methyltransferase subunit D n=1 Tax=Methanoregula formicica (strain DSM 22288 / NBRC 105244 / SMSP) TaxID=593750 RepID=L0HFT9_METFS|nr:tetrahydromethanopterin S-methyltransferase subunit D [Methanoregula formicica]AGB03607.1 N5-methyltetrahydromethanopterin:coenzyme M methyltransferase subunit D [Methanoregula formicica SMSP]